MKKIFLLLSVLGLISCSRDKEESIMLSADAQKIVKGHNYVTEGRAIPQALKQEVIAYFKASRNSYSPKVTGGLTHTVPVPSPSLKNEKIVYTQYRDTYPSTGVYLADVYSYFMKVRLPDNAVGAWVDEVDNEGYVNYTTQKRGFSSYFSVEDGKKYIIAHTYTMVIKYNMVGQAMNVVVPSVSGPKTFKYSYVTL